MPTDTQLQALGLLCDTVVPPLARVPDPTGFWARSATDVGADRAVLEALGRLPPGYEDALLGLLDVLGQHGFLTASRESREQILRNVALMSRLGGMGVGALRSLTLLFTYGLVDPATGTSPFWAQFGYPGPAPAPPAPLAPLAAKPITARVPAGDTTLTADVVVVGSGAGGGVIAGELARTGLAVVVLEAGGHYDEADFDQRELWAYRHLYWRGGPTRTADQNVALLAGACLGGGTVINWSNVIPTKPWVRQEWADEHGLTDVATDFDRHLDVVGRRISVNGDCSDLNRPQQGLRRAAEALGWSFRTTSRNTDPSTYDPATAGHMGFGDRSGSKQSVLRTYLQDAADHGAVIMARCRAERIILDGGRAAGVEATWADPTSGESAAVVVRAPHVVVAAGALESPALLARTGIGGPAVGDHLRLHPCTATTGLYGEDQQAWWGAPQAGLVDEFAGLDGGYGFYVEGIQYTTGFAAVSMPWVSGESHKELMSELGRSATLIGLVRDRGHGRVVTGGDGNPVPLYSLDDEHDRTMTRRALEAQLRAHEAAGAERIVVVAEQLPVWRRGDDLDDYIAAVQRVPLRAGATRMVSAHQMGTCRMGPDPATSVADPRGQLHDTPGVWVGDGSAFPTAAGTNPMITVMALAHRTAEHLADAAGTTLAASAQAVPARWGAGQMPPASEREREP
jgi:choline dehydrogenase-like flavoprotein